MRKLRVVFALMCFVLLAVSAAHAAEKKKVASATSQKTKTKQSLSVATTPQSLGDQIAKYFGKKTGKDLMVEKAGATQDSKGFSTKPATAQRGVSLENVVRPAKIAPIVKPGYVPPPPTPRVAVSQIRQDIQKIIDLNKQIRSVQGVRTVQLQRVQDQARIHQKILNELEGSKQSLAAPKTPAKSTLLSQEKVRMIHEETQRKAPASANPERVSVSAPTKVTSKVQTAAS